MERYRPENRRIAPEERGSEEAGLHQDGRMSRISRIWRSAFSESETAESDAIEILAAVVAPFIFGVPSGLARQVDQPVRVEWWDSEWQEGHLYGPRYLEA